MDWNKESIRDLRLKMGCSQADFARRLNCNLANVENWEQGRLQPNEPIVSELELLAMDAEVNSTEVLCQAIAESLLTDQAINQIDFSELQKEIK